MTRWVLHVDLDQFIAAVEVLRHPELRGRPVVIGGDGDPAKRGVVSTASYEARAFGVRSGLPLRFAVRRCPEAVFLPVDREAYEAASARVMAVLREFRAVVEVFGWDEAFLAVDTGDPERVARQIAERVRARTQLDCSVGIGENKLQAKLATGFGKPAGIFRLTHENWFEVLGDRPTDALWGIGSKTAARLSELGISTVSELAAADPRALATHLGPTTGPWLVQLARGLDPSPVTSSPYLARSRGRETTFQQDLDDWEEMRRQVTRLRRPGRRRRRRRAAAGDTDRGEGPLRALHYPHAWSVSRRADRRPRRYRAGGPGGSAPVQRTAAGTAPGGPRRAGRAAS